MLHNYLLMAFRTLRRNPMVGFINIFGLAAGMAVCIGIGLYVADEYRYDRFHSRFNQIYRVVETQKQADGLHPVAVTPGPLAAALKKDFAEVRQTVRIGQWSGLLQYGGKNIRVENISITDPSLFQVFDFPLVAGNLKTVLQNPDELILTEKMAVALFGSNWAKEGIVGQTILFTDAQTRPLKLVGVAQNLPRHSHIQSEVFLSFKTIEKYDEWSMKWNSNSYHTYLLLHPETNVSAFSRKLSGYLTKQAADAETILQLQPLSDIFLRSKFDFQTDWGKRSDIFYVYLFATIGLLVLLIAVFNFVNLATAQATKRAREVGVRKAAGAARGNLVFQFLIEALLTVGLSLAVALLLTHAALPLLNQLADKALVLPLAETPFWAVMAAFVLVTAVLAGLYPAFVLSSFQPAKVLKGVFAIRSDRFFRQSMVVGQFVLSTVLIISTLFIYRQLLFIQNKKLGFDKEQLLYVRLKGDLRAKGQLLKAEYEKLPGVASVALTTSNLVDVANSSELEWEGQAPKDGFLITQINSDPDLLPTIGATLAAGRNFSYAMATDTSDERGAYLINETAAKRMGWTAEQAVGKTVKFWGFPGSIVGVVKDFHFRPLRVQIAPFIFRFRPKEFYFSVLMKIKPEQVKPTIKQLSAIYTRYEPAQPFDYGFVDQDLQRQYGREQQIGSVFLSFSVLAILISCLGLFGLASFVAEQRTKEIGIRKVLGASIGQLVTLLSRDFLRLVLISLVIATPIAWYATHQWLTDFAYKIDISWWIFALAGLLAIAIALATVSFQAIKAALANPVKSLRSE